MSISSNIKRLRELHNLTQAELGKIAGVSDKAVSTWENGTAEPRMGAIQKIADHFSIPKSELIDDLDHSQMLSPTESHLIDVYRDLNDEGQDKLIDYADDLYSTGKYKKYGSVQEKVEVA